MVGADGLYSNVRKLAFGPQDRFERDLGYRVLAFEVLSYRPRDEEVYVVYCAPGRMLGRFSLHDDRTLFLFVFAPDPSSSSVTLDLPAQKAVLRAQFGAAGWECTRVLEELDCAEDVYFDRVSQIRMDRWSRGRVAVIGDAAFCVSLMAGQGSALAMLAAYVLAGELAASEGRHEQAFNRFEALLRPFIESKAAWRRALRRCLRAEDEMGPVPAQSGDQGLRHPGTVKSHVRPADCRYAAAS